MSHSADPEQYHWAMLGHVESYCWSINSDEFRGRPREPRQAMFCDRPGVPRRSFLRFGVDPLRTTFYLRFLRRTSAPVARVWRSISSDPGVLIQKILVPSVGFALPCSSIPTMVRVRILNLSHGRVIELPMPPREF